MLTVRAEGAFRSASASANSKECLKYLKIYKLIKIRKMFTINITVLGLPFFILRKDSST